VRHQAELPARPESLPQIVGGRHVKRPQQRGFSPRVNGNRWQVDTTGATGAPVRFGLVGYGFGARYFHAPLIASSPACDLVAVATRSAERRALVAREHPDILIAGPAFAAGRYGLACGEVCARAEAELGITAVSGMHAESTAADLYRTRVLLASTRDTALGMADAVRTMARLALARHQGQPLGAPAEEGYIPTGERVYFFHEQTAAERAVAMLLAKVRGEPYTTEWAVPHYHTVDPAPPVRDLASARVALVTTGGVVPTGNPDRLEAAYATKWLRYSIGDLDDLVPERWTSIHGGFNTTNINEDPDRMAPLDALRALEREGVFRELHELMFTTTGNTAAIPTMRRFGQEMVRELRAAEVDGVILTSA
jgi:glycine reductase